MLPCCIPAKLLIKVSCFLSFLSHIVAENINFFSSHEDMVIWKYSKGLLQRKVIFTKRPLHPQWCLGDSHGGGRDCKRWWKDCSRAWSLSVSVCVVCDVFVLCMFGTCMWLCRWRGVCIGGAGGNGSLERYTDLRSDLRTPSG